MWESLGLREVWQGPKPCSLSLFRSGINAWQGAERTCKPVRETPRGPGEQQLFLYGTRTSGHHLPFKSSLLSYLPISLVFTPEKSQVQRVSVHVMILPMNVPGGNYVDCLHWTRMAMTDRCSHKMTPVIGLSCFLFTFTIQQTAFTNRWFLQRDFISCSCSL